MAQNIQFDISHIISAIGQVVTWILVIIGWTVINRQHNVRESRKEMRAQLDILRKSVLQVETRAENYHIAEKHSDEEARKIKVELTRVANIVDRLQLLNQHEQEHRIIKLRKSITLNNFDSHEHKQLSLDSNLIAKINSAVDDLINSLEQSYKQRYKY
jgi:Mg2+ and Co2+ transporter CorA